MTNQRMRRYSLFTRTKQANGRNKWERLTDYAFAKDRAITVFQDFLIFGYPRGNNGETEIVRCELRPVRN